MLSTRIRTACLVAALAMLLSTAAGGEGEKPKEALLYGFESAAGKWKGAWESLDKLEYVADPADAEVFVNDSIADGFADQKAR